MKPAVRVARITLLLLFVAAVAVGLARGEYRDVRQNALVICLSCIGIR